MDGVIVNYNISYINTDTYCFTDSDDITGITEGSYELTGLEEGTEYSIIVNATLSNGGTTEDSIIATTVTAGEFYFIHSWLIYLVYSSFCCSNFREFDCS